MKDWLLMDRFEQTDLWRLTLAPQENFDVESRNRERLRSAFMAFRQRAAALAGEIAFDLPEFTVHDVTHLDALWELAELICGPEYPITPAEAFVLGGAFLIHDLGNGLAAYPDGVEALRSSLLWADTIAALLRKESGRRPTGKAIENASADIQMEAMRQVLRELHAKQADRLALISWRDRNEHSVEYHLIEDSELRQTYGTIIGKIAHSHWWSIGQLRDLLPGPIGAPGGYDKRWTVDPVKLACILRAADASHVDDRRAPGFLAALRKPQGISANHWNFQEKLYQPQLLAGRLTFSSKQSFSLSEVAAWWTCFDTLQMIDKELRGVDALLADSHRPRLAARAVANIEDPSRAALQISTLGWTPVDAKIKVGNVAKLVSNLGGDMLYGKNQHAPLRELVQNGCDAVRARRILEGRDSAWGEIVVRSGTDMNGTWIEVEDTGVGMSTAVLTGPFLDFGNSLWGSPQMHREFPGLEAKGFSSTGQFGIGFFSVFMWGDRVQVVTRRAEAAREETAVLEFFDGLESRPVLRTANASERSMDGGTRVRVWFRKPSALNDLLAEPHSDRVWNLESRCAWLCPALDVSLYVCDPDKQLVVAASDWLTIPGGELLDRLAGPQLKNERRSPHVRAAVRNAALALKSIRDDAGEVIGRCSITIHPYGSARDFVETLRGVIVVGGFRSTELTGIAGIMLGTPYNAARSIALPLANGHELYGWATDQAELAAKTSFDLSYLQEISERIRSLGGETGSLPVAEDCSGRISVEMIKSRYASAKEVVLVQDASLALARRYLPDLKLENNVISVAMGVSTTLQTMSDHWVDWPDSNMESSVKDRALHGLVIEALAAAWEVSVSEVVACSLISSDDKVFRRATWKANGKKSMSSVSVIRRPTAVNKRFEKNI